MMAILEGNDSRNNAVLSLPAMNEAQFRRLGEFIYQVCGIRLNESKKVMLESRLSKRLKVLGMKSYKTYCEYLFSSDAKEDELIHMIDLVTTNKTDFFREPAHFDFLRRTALPELIRSHGAGTDRKLMVWSAGCSTGEEPYTLSMILSDYAYAHRSYEYIILATDISTRVLDVARTGIYREEQIVPVPQDFRKKYLLRGKERHAGKVRIAPELRERVRFRRLNFMEGDFGMREPLDIVFCRNVIIYFDRPTQERLIDRISRHMIPGGYLFMGHSETLNGMHVSFESVAPTVYRKGL
jgi:chemotaxis protein methyltransferase CheR